MKSYKALYQYVEAHCKDQAENILVVDEVQMCEKFELAVNSLHNSHKYDIYVTGSNAFLLSSDLSTLFTGRFIEIPVFPFRQSQKVYIQVSDDISSEETRKRELGPLRAIKDAYPKIVIANTRHETYDIEGIHIMDLSRWLLDRQKTFHSSFT